MVQKELDKMKQGYKTAKADTEEIMILLEAVLKKVKMLRNELKKDEEKISRKRMREKCEEVLQVANPYYKVRKVGLGGNVYETYYEI